VEGLISRHCRQMASLGVSLKTLGFEPAHSAAPMRSMAAMPCTNSL